MSNGNKNQWLVGLIVVGIVTIILVVFNYQGSKTQDLSEIFPEEATSLSETEYEFVSEEEIKAQGAPSAVKGPTKRISADIPSTVSPQAAVTAPSQTLTSQGTGGMSSVYYSIQVLSSKDRAATEKVLEKIKAKGHSGMIVTKDLGEKGIWHRINVGSFATKKEAEDYLPSVKNDYKDSFIIYVK